MFENLITIWLKVILVVLLLSTIPVSVLSFEHAWWAGIFALFMFIPLWFIVIHAVINPN